MKRWIGLIVLGMMLTSSLPVFADSTSVDALIKKLVEKGILNEKEARDLKGEIAADEKVVREEGLKASLPPWVQNTKLKGDFRLRYEYVRKETDTDARIRGRIRYHLGIETPINEKVKVAAGLASGGADPRSTNQSFTDTFSTSDVRLDYAYAEYIPINSAAILKIAGGVFPRTEYLWQTTDMVWDPDITIQGGATHWEYKVNEKITPYANTGVLVIDEISSTTNDKVDPFLWYSQGGVKLKQGDWSANVAGIYYSFNGVKTSCPDWSAATNTGITSASSGTCTGALVNDYDSLGASAELALATPFDIEAIPEAAVFADFVTNIDSFGDHAGTVDNGTAWAAGWRIGDKKVASKGQWQLKYQFVNLGKDGFVDFTPDSDRYGGRTDVRSHEGILEVGLHKNVSAALDYYQSRRIKAAAVTEHTIQADLNFKF